MAPIEERQLIKIGKAVNLERLSLSDVNAADLTALTGRKNLKELSISSSNIADWSEIAQLPQLDKLDVSYNEIEDLSPLGLFAQDGLSVAGNPGAES